MTRRLKTSHRTALTLGLSLSLLVLLSGGLVVGLASATGSDTHRKVNTTDPRPTATATESNSPNGTLIQQGVYLTDRGASNGTASVTLHVEQTTAVTISDGAMSDEGEIPKKTTVLRPGTHTVSLDVTDGPGRALVVSTADTGYYVPIKTPDDDQMFSGDPGWGTVRIAGIGSGLGVLGALGVEAYRRRSGGRKEVRRRA